MEETVAEASTRLMRDSDEPLFVRLREVLTEWGIDPARSVLADFFPDDTNVEFGVVVTPDRRVYEFDLHYGPGDLTNQAKTAIIGEWRDRTDWWQSTPSRQAVEDAMRLLDDA